MHFIAKDDMTRVPNIIYKMVQIPNKLHIIIVSKFQKDVDYFVNQKFRKFLFFILTKQFSDCSNSSSALKSLQAWVWSWYLKERYLNLSIFALFPQLNEKYEIEEKCFPENWFHVYFSSCAKTLSFLNCNYVVLYLTNEFVRHCRSVNL